MSTNETKERTRAGLRNDDASAEANDRRRGFAGRVDGGNDDSSAEANDRRRGFAGRVDGGNDDASAETNGRRRLGERRGGSRLRNRNRTLGASLSDLARRGALRTVASRQANGVGRRSVDFFLLRFRRFGGGVVLFILRLLRSRIVAMSFCEPRSWHNNLSS